MSPNTYFSVAVATQPDGMVQNIYPTWAEANKQVAGVWKRAQVPQWALGWLHRYQAWKRRK